ncbi:MAG: response regulator [Chloroflexi bacterium]|nr:response regulator [Chloroflexota bacterium]
MDEVSHPQSLLLVEDQEAFYAPITRWLEEEGYQVTLASSLAAALTCLETGHYHLTIVDIRLEDDNPQNQEGMKLLEEIERQGINGVMPCIVLTAYANVENILTATQVRHVARFIEKTPVGFRSELLTAVHTQFDETIGINFGLVYDVGTERLIPQIAADINWETPPKPAAAVLIPQVYDLFGRLFARARRLYVAKLTPGLTGAAVVLARPTLNFGMGPSYVVKIGRRDKVKLEAQRCEDFVKPYLPPNTTTQVDVAFTRHLGALQYRFAESDFSPLKEFDEFYKHHAPEAIITSLQNLFQNTGRYWYDNPDRRFADLTQLYFAAFQLDEAKLHGRIQEILPDFTPEQPFLHLPPDNTQILNPIFWLTAHREECVMAVYHCITHGDLTGRNIMVSEQGRCWLIDFYRTHESHILRDFVILETDIKYRLLPAPDDETFARLEHTLLAANPAEIDVPTAVTLPPTTYKAAQVLLALHRIAYEFLRDRNGARQDTRREYLISLLMATLNVARLRHIPAARKLQAILSASFICAELDKLAGREQPAAPTNH